MRSFNIKFPLIDDKELNTYFKMNYITKDMYSSDLVLLLLTEKGERYYEPEYGCNLLKFVFEPNDDLTAVDIEKDIKDTVAKYIPSLTINSVNFYRLGDEESDVNSEYQLNVNVKFTYNENVLTENSELNIKF